MSRTDFGSGYFLTTLIYSASILISLEDTIYPGNKFYLDKNDIFSGWQRKSISKVGLEPSAQPQRVASIDLWYRLICHLDI